MRELQKGGKVRALPLDDKKENLEPIDHRAAAKKLNDILRMTDPDQKHEDLIKSLPTFGTNGSVRKSTSFAKHVKRNFDEQNSQVNEDSVMMKDDSPFNNRNRPQHKSLEPLPVLKNQGRDGTKG